MTQLRHLLIYAIIAFPLVMTVSCKARGEVRATSAIDSSRGAIAIGFIESRDSEFNPFTSSNFIDMLEFELLSHSFQIQDLDYTKIEEKIALKQEEAASRSAQQNHPNQERIVTRNGREINMSDIDGNTDDLLPAHLRYAAGEIAPHRITDNPRKRLLSSEEIKTLTENNSFRYFIQGAVSRNESGYFLDVQENSLVFLDVYNTSGKKIGSVNFVVNSRTLKDAEFLQDVARRVAESLQGIL